MRLWWRSIIEYLYTLNYDNGQDSGPPNRPLEEHDLENVFQLPVVEKVGGTEEKPPTYMDALHLAINLGVATDKFFVKGLKDLTLSKFQSALDYAAHHCSINQIMDIIMSVYENTRKNDWM